MKKTISISALLFFFISHSQVFFAQAPPPLIKADDGNQSQTIWPTPPTNKFNNPALTFELDYFDTSKPMYKPLEVFWRFGEGQYSKLVMPSNTFGEDADVKVWIVDHYDDDDDPPISAGYHGLVAFVSPPPPPPVTMTNSHDISIIPVWSKAMYGDTVMYIIRISTNCTGKEEDPNGNKSKCQICPGILFFEVTNANLALQDNTTLGTKISALYIDRVGSSPPLPNTGQSIVSIPVTLFDGQVTEYLVGFHIQDTKVLDKIPLEVEARISSRCCTWTPATKRDTLGNSHDPNQKTVLSPEVICMEEINDQIRIVYKVEYQNIGTGSAKQVTITDDLDQKDFILSVDPLLAHKNNSSPQPFYNSADKSIRWHLDFQNNPLRGTAEPNYMIDFQEGATKSWLTFEVFYHNDVINKVGYCGALMNQVRIVFDCNLELYTKTTMLKVRCDSEMCGQCEEMPLILVDSLMSVLDNEEPIGYKLPQTILKQINNPTPSTFNWYPDTGLSDPHSLNPVFNPKENTIYHLVIGNSENNPYCLRRTFRIPVFVNDLKRRDHLSIAILEDDKPNDCISTPIIIGGTPPYDYKWSNGSRSSSINHQGARSTFQLTLTDAHGCSRTFSTIIDCGVGQGANPSDPIQWNSWIWAILIALLLWWLYRFINRRG